ncbi:hypothetical protein JCM1841_000520 [Sporobolomyces salmonicolor]
MGLFSRSRSKSGEDSETSESSSVPSDASSAATTASKASSKSKVKPSELAFPLNSASPNSRILSLPTDSPASSPSRRASTLSPTSSHGPSGDPATAVSTAAPLRDQEGTKRSTAGAAAAGAAAASVSRNTSGGANGRSSDQSPNGRLSPSSPPLASPGDLNGSHSEAFDSAASASGNSDFEDAEEAPVVAIEATSSRPRAGISSSSSTRTGACRKGPMSRAARLTAEKMEEDVKTRAKLGKPLASLTAEDVALTEEDIKEDISVIWKAMHLFLSSRMIEAEDICVAACDNRLYYSVGYSLIQAIKSLATFEPEDLEAAIQCCKDSIVITQLLRKRDHGLFERVGTFAKGSSSVNSIKAMTLVQRHAELVYAECTLLKAVLGIIYSGDFLAFLKEALNMRNAYAIYRTLAKYVEGVDAAYSGPGDEDPSIDQDFRSGVRLGNGMISLILSLLPSTVLKIMEVFGFTGDRDWALSTLMKAGGWKAGVKEPNLDPQKEGIRKPICDMVLLMHHLVISNFLPVGGVDVPTAANILHYNLERYPTGIFFLYFAGRLHSTETQLDEAVKSFHMAIQAQREYIQLGHICYWDLGLVSFAMANWAKGYECFNILDKESNWSKAIYAYSKAVCLYEEGTDLAKANEIIKHVPDLMQRIAGKSIPLEKFVARRARKFVVQGNRLTLPGVELAYVLNCLGLSPRYILFERHLDQVSTVLAELHDVKEPSAYGKNSDEYWDDYCLAHFFRGVILRFIAHPEPHVRASPPQSQIPVAEADEQALISFNNVLKHGRDIYHDHHLVWFTHYELGRLFDAQGQWAKAREQYELVLSGKHLEIGHKKGKGKVSLQNMAVLRSNAGLQILKEKGHY